ncbi:MAG: DNA-binding NtrC family response regulator [Desulforhopalus sp.]
MESLGYQVESTTDPILALGMVRTDPDKFDLVISDMSMPNMTGDQLIVKIFQIRPDLSTIVCTGYSSKMPSNKEAMAMGISAITMKPLDKTELATTVRRVLDESKLRS